MARTPRSRTSSNRTLAECEVDKLINVISQICFKLRERNDPGLEDLQRALRRARQLRRRIRDENRRLNWRKLVAAVVALAEVAKTIFSILFYKQPRGLVMRIGSIIKLLRNVQQLPQGELAERLRVTRSYLSQVENDRRQPSLSFLQQAAAALKVPLVLLIPMEDADPADKHTNTELRRLLSNLLTGYLKAKPAAHGGGAEIENARARGT